MTTIPGPTASASLQTARWLARPIRFLEDNRRRYGDAFEVMFKGFKTPLVIVSHPNVLRALYGDSGPRRHRRIGLDPPSESGQPATSMLSLTETAAPDNGPGRGGPGPRRLTKALTKSGRTAAPSPPPGHRTRAR